MTDAKEVLIATTKGEVLSGGDVEDMVRSKIPDYLADKEADEIAYDIVQTLAEEGVLDGTRVVLDD